MKNNNNIRNLILSTVAICSLSSFLVEGCISVYRDSDLTRINKIIVVEIPKTTSNPTVVTPTSISKESVAEEAPIIKEEQVGSVRIYTSIEDLFKDLEKQEVSIKDPDMYIWKNQDMLYSFNGVTDQELAIASYAYERLISTDINIDSVLDELNNIMVYQTVPGCIDEDEYITSFKKLINTLGERESIYSTYSILAWLIHDIHCDYEHTNETGYIVECDQLKKEYTKKRQ